MARAIERMVSGTIGHMGLGEYGQGIGTPRQQVHDGDTIVVRTLGNLSVRFLGIDSPEASLALPGGTTFIPIGEPEWEAFLSDPFAPAYRLPAYPPQLRSYLAAKLGPGCATNHARFAKIALETLEKEIEGDLQAQGRTKETFRFYLRFAAEVMDGYGRLLAFVNREDNSKPRPLTYNERLLRHGVALPYLIWPNVNPFRRQRQTSAAVPKPGTAGRIAQSEITLRQARQWIRDNRDQQRGLFEAGDPLRLEAFELRMLSQRNLPSRWVINLGDDSDTLIPPDRYFEVPNPEDRLFVPTEYVPLFIHHGWKAPGF